MQEFGYNPLKMKEFYDEYRQKNRKITKLEVANEIGISKSSLDNYLTGVSIPSADALFKVAVCFNKRVDDFYNYENPKQINRYENKRIENSIVNENEEHYNNDSEGWKTAFETQKELTEARIEIEKLKKICAQDTIANVG